MKEMQVLIILFTVVTVIVPSGASAADDPDIVFVLVDDLAWGDLSCYGHPWHQTPRIDRLAKQGIRFTNAYAPAPICSASRASILTGKTTARLNFEFVTKYEAGRQDLDAKTPLRAPPLTLNLALKESTIAECLAATGYETAFFGKWHLNAHYKRYLGWSPTHGPKQQGFRVAEEDFGGHPYSWGGQPPESIHSSGEFPTDSMVDRTCDFIRRDHDRPYFLMVSQFYVHTPVKTHCDWLLQKYERLVPSDSPARERRIHYAAFVETLDHYVGGILDAIDQSGRRDNTLVVFLSDNGGHPEFTGNGPLRGSKWNLFEGGIRVPMIARWSNRIEPSSTCGAPVIGYDLLPTFADIAHAPVGNVDGTSLVPLLAGMQLRSDRDLIWHFPYYHPETGFAAARDTIGVNDFVVSRTRPQSAIRRGRYKLIKFYEDNHNELYDLETDESEQHDLSLVMPDTMASLSQALELKLHEMNARFPDAAR